MDVRNKIKIEWIFFILAVSVIYIHAYNAETYQLTESMGIGWVLYRLENWLNRMQAACVPAFFMISGYLFFRNYSWDKVWDKYKSRIKSLLFPYLLWCTLYFLLYFFVTNIPIIAIHMNMEKVEFSIPYYLECLWNSTYTVLWFVKSLLFAIIGTPLYYAVMRKKETLWGECISVILSIVLIGYSITGRIYILNDWFLIGSFLALRCSKQVEANNKYKTAIGIIGCLFCALWIFPEEKASSWLWIALMIFSVWNALDVFKFVHEPKWWQRQTFWFYCGHSFLLETLEKMWLIFAGNSVWAAAIDYVFMPWVTVVILSIIAFTLNRYCTSLYCVLTGGRNH